MTFTYKTNGVCSRFIDIEIENDILVSVKYTGGCNGNLQGISRLVKGMKVDEVIEKLENIKCGYKDTSCPAQLALALKEYNKTKGD
ncbi:MAG: TIGR03905 family TSCPD domain-containing protein [Clostridia bacterium]|nr:TIGR03905 family TSCPD domain-containing protein [Clostridia bacterium]